MDVEYVKFGLPVALWAIWSPNCPTNPLNYVAMSFPQYELHLVNRSTHSKIVHTLKYFSLRLGLYIYGSFVGGMRIYVTYPIEF